MRRTTIAAVVLAALTGSAQAAPSDKGGGLPRVLQGDYVVGDGKLLSESGTEGRISVAAYSDADGGNARGDFTRSFPGGFRRTGTVTCVRVDREVAVVGVRIERSSQVNPVGAVQWVFVADGGTATRGVAPDRVSIVDAPAGDPGTSCPAPAAAGELLSHGNINVGDAP